MSGRRGLWLVPLLLLPGRPASAERLADVIAEVYDGNPTLLRERMSLKASDESLVQARAGLSPNFGLELSGGYDRQDYLSGGPGLRDQGRNGAARITLTQPLYTGGRVSAEIDAAAALIRGGRAALRSVEGDVLFRAIQAYADVQRDQAALDVQRHYVDALTDVLKEVSARQNAGDGTMTDIYQAQTQLAAAQAQLGTARNQLETSRSAFADVVGHAPGDLTPAGELPGVPADLDSAASAAIATNPDVEKAVRAEQQSAAKIGVARATGRPTVQIEGNAGYFETRDRLFGRDPDRSASVAVAIRMPLWTGGRNASITREAVARNGADRLAVDITRRALTRNVSDAWGLMTTARANEAISVYQEAKAVETRKAMQIEYRAGQRSIYDVLVADGALREARLQYLASVHDSFVATAALLRHVGRLEAHKLVTGLGEYDPAKAIRPLEFHNDAPLAATVEAFDRLLKPRRRGRLPSVRPSPAPGPVAAIAPVAAAPTTGR